MRVDIVPSWMHVWTTAAAAVAVLDARAILDFLLSSNTTGTFARGAAGLFLITGTAGCTRGADTFAGAPASLTIGEGAPAILCTAEGNARFWSRWDALSLGGRLRLILRFLLSSITTGTGVPGGRARGIGGRGTPTCSPETTHEIAGGTHVGEKPLRFAATRSVSQSVARDMFHGHFLTVSAVLMNYFCWRAENCTRPDMVPGPSAESA